MRQLFYYKMRQKLIMKCVRFFIINFIIKAPYRFYYKMRPLLQIVTVSFNEIQDNFSEVCKKNFDISLQNNAVNEFSVSEADGEKDKLINMTMIKYHCVKCVQIRSFFWSVFSRIQSECGKIRTRKNFVFGHFSRSVSDKPVSRDRGKKGVTSLSIVL